MVRRLALGRLDDSSAVAAEQALASCAVCSRWWAYTLEGEAVAELDQVVADSLGAFQPPRVVRPWVTSSLAAAAALLVGLGLVTLAHRPPTPAPSNGSQVAAVEQADCAVLAVLDFEAGALRDCGQAAALPRTAPPREVPSAARESQLHAATMETGDLSGWSSHS